MTDAHVTADLFLRDCMMSSNCVVGDDEAWDHAVSVAELRASLKQVLKENELLKLRIMDVRGCNMRAANLLVIDDLRREADEPSSPLPHLCTPSFAPPSPTPTQRLPINQ
ncbi:hypothetical protein WJX75_003091 [Coccomyxa subellipsoidea]|uniref:Uncharacterized protein n=1 Tax=Coccomyxa subellipsoidea TaxID=248742 RepID=A0ABR2YSZ6_9CHLO